MLACVAAVIPIVLGGCSGSSSSAETPQLPKSAPAAWNLTSPESAVHSYLDWTTFSYRMINSDLSSPTASGDEGVRVDSYVELLKQKGQGIDQRLTAFAVVRQSAEGTRTLIATKETWEYRYFSSDGKRYVTPSYTTSYDTTYTVIRLPSGSFVVDNVDAKPLDAVH